MSKLIYALVIVGSVVVVTGCVRDTTVYSPPVYTPTYSYAAWDGYYQPYLWAYPPYYSNYAYWHGNHGYNNGWGARRWDGGGGGWGGHHGHGGGFRR